MTKKLSDHDLLVRIDERQKSLNRKMGKLCKSLHKKVDKDEDYKDMVDKVQSLWDDRNRVIGWILGSAGVGGIAGGLAAQIKDVLSKGL